MMQFRYKATNINGEIIKGYKKVRNYQELIAALKKDKLFCIYFQEVKTNILSRDISIISAKDLTLYCKYMNTSLRAGMNICDILNLISLQLNNKKLSSTLNEVRISIENGNSLNEALDKFSDIFPVFLRKMVYLGEETGKLQDIFINLENYYHKKYKRNRKVINSLIYPFFVLIISVIIGVFMISKILPKFISQITNLGGDLPYITKLYLNIGSFLNNNGILFILIMILSCVFTLYLLKCHCKLESLSSIVFKIPMIKYMMEKFFYYRFSISMYILLSSGISVINALNIATNCEKSYYFYEKLYDSTKAIERGTSISKALDYVGIFPRYFINMIGIGEENGTLEEMLKTSSEIFEEDLNSAIDKAASLIEPILILVIGIFIASIVIAIMVPIFNLSTRGF